MKSTISHNIKKYYTYATVKILTSWASKKKKTLLGKYRGLGKNKKRKSKNYTP